LEDNGERNAGWEVGDDGSLDIEESSTKTKTIERRSTTENDSRSKDGWVSVDSDNLEREGEGADSIDCERTERDSVGESPSAWDGSSSSSSDSLESSRRRSGNDGSSSRLNESVNGDTGSSEGESLTWASDSAG
jgi:hypothetical protein